MSMATSALLLVVFLSFLLVSTADQSFDVRQHLSTVTRYGAVKEVADNNGFVPSVIPVDCNPIHINLVARHGTRSPTKKRIKELDRLATRLEILLSNAKREADKGSVFTEKIPNWLWGWQSPWKGKLKGGELTRLGEAELYDPCIRIRERFQDLFEEEYHPDIYTIKATQIPRASASAMAFGMGLFNWKGSLGPGGHRAFAVTSESRASDILLRFHDTCDNYKQFHEWLSSKARPKPRSPSWSSFQDEDLG